MINQSDFFQQINVSERTLHNYKVSLKSKFLREQLKKAYNVSSIFEITSLDELWDFYCKINRHPINIANHRGYSCAIMQYIRFLNDGKKYGKRIDYKKTKSRRKNNKG